MYIYFCMKNSGAYLERRVAGLRSLKVQGRDFTNQAWGYQVIISKYWNADLVDCNETSIINHVSSIINFIDINVVLRI